MRRSRVGSRARAIGRSAALAVALSGAAGLVATGCVGDSPATTGSGGSNGAGSGGNNGGTGSGGNNGGTGTGGNNGGTGSGGNNGGTGSGGSPNVQIDCPSPNNGSPLLRLLTRTELLNSLNDIFPEVKSQWQSSLPANQISDFGFDNAASSTLGGQLAEKLTDTALSLATAVVGSPLSSLLPCSTSAADHACAETFVNKYGRRLFRRPMTTAEHDWYLAFFDASKTKSDFKTALKWTLVGLIQSPNAVYRSELGTAQGDSRMLTPFEQATALAYTYTGTTPTDDLLSKAEKGTLGDPVATARTMVATDAGKLAMQRFFEGYVGYTAVTSISKPAVSNFPTLSQDMFAEMRAFIDDVVIKNGGGMKELLTAPTTNPSKALASFYGFPAPGSDYAQVTRPSGRGVGILAQGAFLATHASSDSSSPTKRGLFPFLRLLCQKKLSPPPVVPQITAPMPGQKTTRQRYEDVHVKGGDSCAACHKLFDPIGFAFEHYDETGRFRADEGGLPIDSSGMIPKFDKSDAITFDGEESLMSGLADQAVVHQCMAAYLSTFAFGTEEACIGASSVADLQADKIGIQEAFVRLAGEPHFTKRNAQ